MSVLYNKKTPDLSGALVEWTDVDSPVHAARYEDHLLSILQLFCFVFFVDDRRIFRIHHDRLLGAGHLRVL